MYKILFTKAAQKDFKLIQKSPYRKIVLGLLDTLETNPYKPPFEQLIGDMKEAFSRRINKQHRLVYKIDDKAKQVTVISMWGHYDDN